MFVLAWQPSQLNHGRPLRLQRHCRPYRANDSSVRQGQRALRRALAPPQASRPENAAEGRQGSPEGLIWHQDGVRWQSVGLRSSAQGASGAQNLCLPSLPAQAAARLPVSAFRLRQGFAGTGRQSFAGTGRPVRPVQPLRPFDKLTASRLTASRLRPSGSAKASPGQVGRFDELTASKLKTAPDRSPGLRQSENRKTISPYKEKC